MIESIENEVDPMLDPILEKQNMIFTDRSSKKVKSFVVDIARVSAEILKLIEQKLSRACLI